LLGQNSYIFSIKIFRRVTAANKKDKVTAAASNKKKGVEL